MNWRTRITDPLAITLAEVGACVDLAQAFGFSSAGRVEALKGGLHLISRMLWRLGNPATP